MAEATHPLSSIFTVLRIHFSPVQFDVGDGDIQWASAHGLIEASPDGWYRTTEAGRVYVEHLARQPMPVPHVVWRIPC